VSAVKHILIRIHSLTCPVSSNSDSDSDPSPVHKRARPQDLDSLFDAVADLQENQEKILLQQKENQSSRRGRGTEVAVRGAYAGRGKKRIISRRRAPDPEEADDEDQLSEDEVDIDDDRDADDFEDMINLPYKHLSPPVQAAKTTLMVSTRFD
jgi:hypothetical protein